MDGFKKIASPAELEALKNLIQYENSGEHKPLDKREKLLCDFTKPLEKIKNISAVGCTQKLISITAPFNAQNAVKTAESGISSGAEYIEFCAFNDGKEISCREFFGSYSECALAVKAAFPEVKVGAGGFSDCVSDYVHEFMNYLATHKRVPFDFLSWHKAASKAEQVQNYAYAARTLLDKYGFEKTESIITFWNYEKSITSDALKMKEAAFAVATLISLQKTPADFAAFSKPRFEENEKCRLAFDTFGMLSSLGIEVTSDSAADHVYVLGCKNDDKGALMAVNFNPYEEILHECVLDLKGIFGKKCEIYLLDKEHNLEIVYSGSVPESYKLGADSVIVVKLI